MFHKVSNIVASPMNSPFSVEPKRAFMYIITNQNPEAPDEAALIATWSRFWMRYGVAVIRPNMKNWMNLRMTFPGLNASNTLSINDPELLLFPILSDGYVNRCGHSQTDYYHCDDEKLLSDARNKSIIFPDPYTATDSCMPSDLLLEHLYIPNAFFSRTNTQ